MKATTVRARIDESLKAEVEIVLGELGLTLSEAITLFMAQIKLKRGIPFAIKVPNHVTLQVFKDTDSGKNIKRCKNTKDFFDQIGI